ncbi:hypothetical protein HDU67_006828 [Dinochytrium kinnereticum]|nr:hypothetical protein HDU67_006828 [Dinochytrium kinnereticum]
MQQTPSAASAAPVTPVVEGDPNVLHSLKELHDTLIHLVESGMKKEQTWGARRPSQQETSAGYSNIHLSIDSILEEIDSSLNEMNDLQTGATTPLTPRSPKSPRLPRPHPLHQRSRSDSTNNVVEASSDGALWTSGGGTSRYAMMMPTSPQVSGPPSVPDLGTLMATTGTYFGRVERLMPRTSREDPFKWVKLFIVVDGYTIHLFHSENTPMDRPIESIVIAGERSEAIHSGRGMFVIRTGVPAVRLVFRGSSNDEADAWSAILTAAIQLSKAQSAAMMQANQPHHGYEGDMIHPGVEMHRSQSYSQLPQRHVVPHPVMLDQRQQRPINTDPVWNKRCLTPASPTDLPSKAHPPLPSQPLHPRDPRAATTTALSTSPPDSLFRPTTPTFPPQNPGVFRSRRNSDSDVSRLSVSDAIVRKPSVRFGRTRTRTAEDASIHSGDSGASSSGGFKIQKMLGISSGGTPGSRTHVYLVRGGARQPGGPASSGAAQPTSSAGSVHSRSMSLGSTDMVISPAAASQTLPDNASISSDLSDRSTSSSMLRIVPAKSGSATGPSSSQVVVLAQAPEIVVEEPKAPKKSAKVFMVRGGSQFRAAPNANRLVKITVPANPVVARAAAAVEAVEESPLSPSFSGSDGEKKGAGRRVFLVRTGGMRK